MRQTTETVVDPSASAFMLITDADNTSADKTTFVNCLEVVRAYC
jgi:hypothetical protein